MSLIVFMEAELANNPPTVDVGFFFFNISLPEVCVYVCVFNFLMHVNLADVKWYHIFIFLSLIISNDGHYLKYLLAKDGSLPN